MRGDIYKLGYKTPESLLAIEPDWRQNWRGKGGGGTPEQFATFAAELKSKSNGNAPPEEFDSRPVTLDAMEALQ